MKLSQENITFIDTYLLKSDIRHLDVRSEMVDHVATQVELVMQKDSLSFYDAFKNYMVVHKKDLLDFNKKFIKKTDIIVLKKLGKEFLSPIVLGSIVISFFALQFVVTPENKSIIAFLPIVVLLSLLAVYFVMSFRLKKQRFSGLERVGSLLTIFSQLLYPFFKSTRVIQNDNIFCGVLSLFIGLLIAYLLVLVQFYKKYTKRYLIA